VYFSKLVAIASAKSGLPGKETIKIVQLVRRIREDSRTPACPTVRASMSAGDRLRVALPPARRADFEVYSYTARRHGGSCSHYGVDVGETQKTGGEPHRL
jgi:type IV secretory pathway ATPase VirB11/archaellum biosynthesis ATPase